MYDAADIIRVLGAEANAYAHNKNRGGRNNGQGATYEAFYAGAKAIGLMAEALRSGDDGETIFLQEQQLCFIDDLIIDRPAGRTLSQLKSGQTTGWSGKPHAVADDFRNQAKLDLDLGVTANYELVVPNETLRQSLVASRPSDVVADVVAFSDATLIQDFLVAQPELIEDIDQIAVSDKPRPSVRGQVLKTVLGAWATSGARVSLADFAKHAADGPGPVVTTLGPEYELPEDVRLQLEAVPGLDFEVRKKHLWYRFGGALTGRSSFRGGTPEFTRFERFIVDHQVTDAFLVIEALKEDA